MKLFGISFILVSCLSSLCVEPALANWPVFSIEKGGTAVVPCVPKGDETAYFWSKGEDFATSQSVASRVLGIPSSDSEKYLVNGDGSLVIYNVTLAEGGRYHCRIVSENTNCRGAVSIEVTVNDFTFGIEQCEPSESCTLQVEASKETKLTCTAKGGPSSLSLKWFNGSKEMNSVSNEHPLNEESSTVSETITVPNEFGLPLTCKAVASKDEQSCARLAHVRLDKTDTTNEQTDAETSSARWIIPIIVGAVIIVSLLIYIYARRKKYTQKKKSFKTTTDRQEEQISEKDTLLEQKGGKIEKLQDELQQKGGKIEKLQDELQKKGGELKNLQDELQQKGGKIEKLQDELQKKGGELKNLQDELQDANIALETIKTDLTAENITLKNANIALEAVKKNLTAENMTLKEANLALEVAQKNPTAKNQTQTEANLPPEKAQNDLTATNETKTGANLALEEAQKNPTAKSQTQTEANLPPEKAQDDLTATNETKTGGAE